MQEKIAGFIPDTHIPFEDQRAYSLMLKVFKYIHRKYGLACITLLGDYIDLYGLSFYEKDPSFGDLADLYDREIECANKRLDELDSLFPESKKLYIEGNHEFRFKKYFKLNGGPLRRRLTVPKELKLGERPKWTWVPYHKHQAVQILGSPLWARHEPFGTAQPMKQAEKSGDSFIYGHTHQIGEGHYTTKLTGREVSAINSGCLIDFGAKCFDYVKDRPSWRHAFTVAWVSKKDFHHQVVRITKDYACIFDGKRFEA